MKAFDFYINPEKPTLGCYVPKGAGLKDLADADKWQLEGQVWESELSPSVLAQVLANGHAFQELGS